VCDTAGNKDCELACNGSYLIEYDDNTCSRNTTLTNTIVLIILVTVFSVTTCFCVVVCVYVDKKAPHPTSARIIFPNSPTPPMTFCMIASEQTSSRSADIEAPSPRSIDPSHITIELPKKKREKITIVAVPID